MAAAIICGAILFGRHNYGGKKIASTSPVQTGASVGLPLRIMIPSIHVDASIEKVGVTSDGDMDTSKLPFDTAWYGLGPRPGEIGSAVIDGHVDWKNGASAVFADLYRLKPGDKVVVKDDRGLLINYVVLTSRIFNPDSDATDVFRSNDGKAHLNLITCVGSWNKDIKGYSQRLVVFTDKE